MDFLNEVEKSIIIVLMLYVFPLARFGNGGGAYSANFPQLLFLHILSINNFYSFIYSISALLLLSTHVSISDTLNF